MMNYMNSTNATAPDVRARLISFTSHNDGGWQTTVYCDDATSPDPTLNTNVLTARMDDDAWQAT